MKQTNKLNSPRKKYPDKRVGENKRDRKEYNKEYYEKNKDIMNQYSKDKYPDKKDSIRNNSLKRNYNITVEEYNDLFEKQEGKCLICGTHQDDLNVRLAVDHNHETGEVRGLLCNKCNLAIGLLGESGDLLYNSLSYLGLNKKKLHRILFLNPDKGHTCSFYRSGGVVKDLRHKLGPNYQIDVISWPDMPIDWQSISNFDLVMMQRPYQGSMLDFAKRIKAMNIPLWLDYDDNLFTVATENRAWAVFNDPQVKKYVAEFLTIADVITVTNEDLKEAYLPFNKNIIVVPNAFNDSIFDVNREVAERENTILWRGSDTHIYDIMTYAPAISKAAEEHKDYEFTYVGYYPWFLAGPENVNFIKPMEVIDYFNNVNTVHAKAVHVPLVDNNFNRCKSNIAFIEASYWGAVSIIPKWWGDIPGTLQYTDNQSYYECLRQILEDKVNVKSMNELAWNYVKENLLLSTVNDIRVKVIKDILHG